ncbi:MAG: hypothetical protein ACTSPB_04100 [Candidatus Thorarchaeota archaeon]
MKHLFIYVAGPTQSYMYEDKADRIAGLDVIFHRLIDAGIPTHQSDVYNKSVLSCCSDLLVIAYKGFNDDPITKNMIAFARANDIPTFIMNPGESSNLDNFITVLRNRTTNGAQQTR